MCEIINFPVLALLPSNHFPLFYFLTLTLSLSDFLTVFLSGFPAREKEVEEYKKEISLLLRNSRSLFLFLSWCLIFFDQGQSFVFLSAK